MTHESVMQEISALLVLSVILNRSQSSAALKPSVKQLKWKGDLYCLQTSTSHSPLHGGGWLVKGKAAFHALY